MAEEQQQLPQLYHLEHDQVPLQLQQQQMQMEHQALNEINMIDKSDSTVSTNTNQMPELIATNQLVQSTNNIDLIKVAMNELIEDSSDSSEPIIMNELDSQQSKSDGAFEQQNQSNDSKKPITETITIDELQETNKSESNELIQTEDSSDLLQTTSLECDEPYIDRSTSSIDLENGLKSDPINDSQMDEDNTSSKQSTCSNETEDRSNSNEIENDELIDKLSDEMVFNSINNVEQLTLELVRDVVNQLKKFRCRTDKPRIVRILQKACNLSRQKVVAFINQALDKGYLERTRYREYFGIRVKTIPDSILKLTDIRDTNEDSNEILDLDKEDTLLSDQSINRPLLDSIMHVLNDQSISKNGSSCENILKLLQDKQLTNLSSIEPIQSIVQEQVDKKNGMIEELSAGVYRLKQGSNKNKLLAQKNIKVTNNNKRKHSPFPDKTNVFEDEASAEYIINKVSEINSTKKDEIVQRARPVSQRKKIKKSLGPDFLDPTELKYQYTKFHEFKCEYCGLAGFSYSLVSCKKCKSSIHTRCVEKKNDVTGMKRLSANDCYLCEKCRLRCAACLKDDLKLMAICKGCSDVFHLDCISEGLDCDTSGNWYCSKCTLENSQPGPDGLPKKEPIKSETTLREISYKVKNCKLIKFKKEAKSDEASNDSETLNTETAECSELTTPADDDNSNSVKMAEEENEGMDSDSCDQDKSEANEKSNIEDDNLNAEIKCETNDSDQPPSLSLNDKEDKNDVPNGDVAAKDDYPLLNSNEIKSTSADEESSQSSCLSANPASNGGSLSNDLNNEQYDEALVEQYRCFLPNYDRQRDMFISKEDVENLKSLNSYSNGKNPQDWSVEDVQKFISEIGFPEQSALFGQERIDGRSLLLLRRHDVLTGFSMRLGHALKIYAHIYKLQGSL